MFPIPTYLLDLLELNLPYTLNHCHEPVTMLVITLDYWIFQMTLMQMMMLHLLIVNLLALVILQIEVLTFPIKCRTHSSEGGVM